jgi:phosphoribosylformylglycinamidine synthase
LDNIHLHYSLENQKIRLFESIGNETLRTMKILVNVMPKPSVLDPQGAAAAEALKHLGLAGVGRVRIGKVVEIELPDNTEDSEIHRAARELLSNPVIEDYSITK